MKSMTGSARNCFSTALSAASSASRTDAVDAAMVVSFVTFTSAATAEPCLTQTSGLNPLTDCVKWGRALPADRHRDTGFGQPTALCRHGGIVLVAPNTDAASHQKRAVVSRWVNEIHCSKKLFGEHRATLSGKQHLFAQKQQFFGHRRTVIHRVHVEVVELVGHPLRSNEAGRRVEEPRAHICVGSR